MDERPPIPDRVLRVSAALFRRSGFHATTTRQLAEALGLQKASLYHYIEQKHDLLREICLVSLDRLKRAATQAVDDFPEARVPALVRAHVLSVLGDRDMHLTMLSEMRFLPMESQSIVAKERRQYQDFVEAVITNSVHEGQLRRDIDPERLTLILLGSMNWVAFWPSHELTGDREALVSDVVSATMAGMQDADRARQTSA